MLGAARLSLVPAIIAAWLFLPSTAHAIVPQVHDNGKFFTPETVKKANDLLLRIQEKHKKDVVVETFGEIPEKVLQRFKYDPKNRRSFFEQWAKDIAKEGKVDGIVILIAKDQNHNNSTWIETDAGENTKAKSFRSADLTDLHNIFESGWSKDRNAALVEGLQFTDTRMAAHHSAASAPLQSATKSTSSTTAPSSSGGYNIMGIVCIGLCVLLGIWLVVGLVRAFTGGGGHAGGGGGGYGPGYGGGYGGGGGGGFMSGLMGGIFGAMAGNWIYNNMFGGHSSWGGSTAHAGESPASGRDDFGPSDQGQGFSGVGGDVDGGSGGDVDGGGGGDWGGGGGDTGGGGDWGGGGGDAGGGGDWGGGGGGDFGGGGGDFGGGGGGGDW